MYLILFDYLKIEDKVLLVKKIMDKVKYDLKRKEVIKYMSKLVMVGGRCYLLMVVLMGGLCSESLWNKKRRK